MKFYQNKPLVTSLLLSMALAATEVPLWISLFSFLMIFWKYVHEKFNVKKISAKLTPILGLVIFGVVFIQYKTILGQEESIIVLMGLVSLVILNYETGRDKLFLVLLGFLILVIKSVFSLDFIWTFPALFSFFGLWYSLITSERINRIRYLIRTVKLSIPILVILFILFPRLVVFQNKPLERVMVQSGFSEDLNPGRFAEVAMLDQMVFRAEFYNNQMQTNELYWRGTVLTISKGFIWHKGVVDRVYAPIKNENERAINYSVIIEPLTLRNVFVLDTPIRVGYSSAPINEYKHSIYALSEFQNQQVQFQAEALFNYFPSREDDPTHLKKYLNYPELPPKTKALADEIVAKHAEPKERIEALKKFFTQKGFIYTLKPEKYRNNLDEFLFERRKGFCEHFAASFGTLARAVGVPSRVVVGYQGGSYNRLGNFWKISQKDAHAWVEVALDGRWLRVDPTSWIAPLRFSIGGEQYFALPEEQQILYSRNNKVEHQDNFGNVIGQVRLLFENLNYYWTVFLLNYDLQAQLNFLRQFQGQWIVGIFILFLLVITVGRSWFVRRKSEKPAHPYSSVFKNIEVWAIAQGVDINKSDTPLQILSKIGQKFPATQDFVRDFSESYQNLIYRDRPENMKDPKQLSQAWKKTIRQSLKRSAEF